MQAKRFDFVFAQCQRLLRKHPRNVSLLSLAGSAAFSLRRYAEAEALLSRALALRPDSPALRAGLERVRRKL